MYYPVWDLWLLPVPHSHPWWFRPCTYQLTIVGNSHGRWHCSSWSPRRVSRWHRQGNIRLQCLLIWFEGQISFLQWQCLRSSLPCSSLSLSLSVWPCMYQSLYRCAWRSAPWKSYCLRNPTSIPSCRFRRWVLARTWQKCLLWLSWERLCCMTSVHGLWNWQDIILSCSYSTIRLWYHRNQPQSECRWRYLAGVWILHHWSRFWLSSSMVRLCRTQSPHGQSSIPLAYQSQSWYCSGYRCRHYTSDYCQGWCCLLFLAPIEVLKWTEDCRESCGSS